MNRSFYLIGTVMLFVCGALQVAEKPLRQDFGELTRDTQGRPNDLFITVDVLNDWIGVLEGNSQAKTHDLNRLAMRSVYLTNAHCSTPVCNSGLYLTSSYECHDRWSRYFRKDRSSWNQIV